MTNTFSSIPFQSRDYDGIERTRTFLDQQGCFSACQNQSKRYNAASREKCNNECSKELPSPNLKKRTFLDQQKCFSVCNDQSTTYDSASRELCNNGCLQPFQSKNLQRIFEDVAAQEKIYQSATQKLTTECEFWKNIFTTLADENIELFSLDAQKNVSWELSLLPDAADMNEKVQVFRNGIPDYCLNSNHLPLAGNRECADLSFAESYASELHALKPSTLREKKGSSTDYYNFNPLIETVAQIKNSVALNDPNKHETAIQSITDTIEESKKNVLDNVKQACALHRRKASENAFKFWSDEEQTSWVVADKNDNVFYSFTLKA